jgi:hypothetical protein
MNRLYAQSASPQLEAFRDTLTRLVAQSRGRTLDGVFTRAERRVQKLKLDLSEGFVVLSAERRFIHRLVAGNGPAAVAECAAGH